MTRFEAIERARIERGGRDTTAPVPGVQEHKPAPRVTSPDGLTFRFGSRLKQPRAYANGRGIGAMSPEKRREQSKLANAARWAK